MTTLAHAIARRNYELAALRMLLGVVATIDEAAEAAPDVRAELVALLMPGDSAARGAGGV